MDLSFLNPLTWGGDSRSGSGPSAPSPSAPPAWSEPAPPIPTDQPQNQIQTLANPYAGNYGSQLVQQGLEQGRQRGELLYGQSMGMTGAQTQDIIKRRQESLEGDSPEGRQLRKERNRRTALAKQRGATAGQQAAIERESGEDIRKAAWSREQQALGDYQATIGNVLSGQSTLELMHGGLGAASIPRATGTEGGGITVICTELNRQGILSDKELEWEKEYGMYLRKYDPAVYWGYRKWADPVVEMMKKSKVITKVVSLFAVPWVRKTKLGKVIDLIGTPMCRIIGKWRGYGKVQSA